MRKTLLLSIVFAIAAGCAPRQDPGIPLPKPGSGAAALGMADTRLAPTQ